MKEDKYCPNCGSLCLISPGGDYYICIMPNCGTRLLASHVVEPKYIVRDSGEREQADTGMVRDVRIGKGRFDLISPHALRRLALIYEKGAQKYSDRNWEKGMSYGRFIDSAIRHINSYLEGDHVEDNLAQAVWNLFCIMHFENTGRTELQDIPTRPEYKKKEE